MLPTALATIPQKAVTFWNACPCEGMKQQITGYNDRASKTLRKRVYAMRKDASWITRTSAPELREKAKACTSPDELLALAKKEGYKLSEDGLTAVSGGGNITWCSSFQTHTNSK